MKKLFMIVALLCGIQNAWAAFIDRGTYLTDTTSGLDWLDVTASVNRSYNDVSSQFGVGGDFAGWRYATGLEFNGLVGHWTGVMPSGNVSPWVADAGDGLVAALGSTMDSMYISLYGMTYDASKGVAEGAAMDATTGLIADIFLGYRQYAQLFDREEVAPLDYSLTYAGSAEDSAKWLEIGSFLVRQSAPIPEPTTIALLGLGLAGLCFSRRKVKANGLS